MAKIDVEALKKQIASSCKRTENKRLRSIAREKKDLQKRAKTKAREIIKSLPGLLKKEAGRGNKEVTVLNSSSIMDERLFKEVVSQVSSWCWENNLDAHIKKHEPVGMDDYPYHETLVVGLK